MEIDRNYLNHQKIRKRMKTKLSARMYTYILLFVFLGCTEKKKESDDPEIKTVQGLFERMKSVNDSLWFKDYTFKQHTVFYDQSGKKKDSALWHEKVSYPYLFRIDRDIEKGNYTVYRNDSTYHVLADTLYSATDHPAAHLVFKGGLYFIPLQEAIGKLEQYGYDLRSFKKDSFMGEPVYIIGDTDNQFWLHAKNYYCMRRIYNTDEGKIVDVVYEDFKPLGRGWVEQKVTFYLDRRKTMEEFYLDITIRDSIAPKTYEIPKEIVKGR
tara:strand:- start:691 stop:1494 length:804 start_codon:yes stop_codon:yes gene_type:complete